MNKDLKYMPIDDRAGTWMSKHTSPLFQKERSSEATGLRTDSGDNNALLDEKGRTQSELMAQLAKKFKLSKTTAEKTKNFNQFNKAKDSIATVNKNYTGF